MILLLHISLATISIIFAGIAYARPARINLHISYGLVGGTLVSGAILMAGVTTHLVEATVSGVIYLSIVTVVVGMARRRVLSVQ